MSSMRDSRVGTVSPIAGARVEMIDGAAHLPQIEQTEKVSKLVADFLGK